MLAAERIKLTSTRSPWWCGGLAVLIVAGFTALVYAVDEPVAPSSAWRYLVTLVRILSAISLCIVMVMAALAVTSEYRFSTIRTTFQAVPNRTVALLVKTAVVAGAAAVIGLVASFGAWAAAWLLSPSGDLAIGTEVHWRAVAGVAVQFAVAAVFAVAVGILIRHTAGAVALLLIWVLAGEAIVSAIPRVGGKVAPGLPFTNLEQFVTAGSLGTDEVRPELFGPWVALAVAVGGVAIVLAAALLVANRRDA